MPDAPTTPADSGDSPHQRSNSAYFASSIAAFLLLPDSAIYAKLTQSRGLTLTAEQLVVWQTQLPILRTALSQVSGWIHIEFDIPRLGKRADAVIVAGSAIIVIEFKVGATTFHRADIEQAWDYALDLKNFHEESHLAQIYPILCATAAVGSDPRWRNAHDDGVSPPFCCNASDLSTVIGRAIARATGQAINGDSWGRGRYSPTPTIIEAARALYGRHTVHDIVRNDAEATNLSITSDHVEGVIAATKSQLKKSIVFVTGVPGAGKTLVGLNVATRHGHVDTAVHATFLSGNGPLVSVLREALARDDHHRRRVQNPKSRIGESRSAVQTFIQRIHHFRDEMLRDPSAPKDHIVVFDEAQRAWHSTMLGNFMKRKRGMSGFTQSEPELLIGAMDRHKDWAAVICLVGGGQEINIGEAGIAEWLDAVRLRFPHWEVHLSTSLSDSEFTASESISALQSTEGERKRVFPATSLHLATSMRSFRTEHLSSFIKALLDGDVSGSLGLHQQFHQRYPIVVTRSMKIARNWIRGNCRGSQRAGIVASSSAQRLKPHAVDIRVNVNPIHWFLNDAQDTRSSQYLEDAATEFQVQGLELDWTIVAWDADLRRVNDQWSYHSFRGAGWTQVRNTQRRRYLLNAYRVLLTRARQGMVIFVPPGRRRDKTRPPGHYDGIYNYLLAVGVHPV